METVGEMIGMEGIEVMMGMMAVVEVVMGSCGRDRDGSGSGSVCVGVDEMSSTNVSLGNSAITVGGVITEEILERMLESGR